MIARELLAACLLLFGALLLWPLLKIANHPALVLCLFGGWAAIVAVLVVAAVRRRGLGADE